MIYYKTIFALAQHHKYSIRDIEEMIPFELDLYTDLLIEYLQSQKENS